jgi:hypothetical protein
MRWRRTFMAEVFESLLRLGLRACPVCGSTESLSMSPFPAIMVDGEFPLDSDELAAAEGGDLTFAVRIECTTCGHLMLFNAQRYRTSDAKSIEYEITGEERPLGHPTRWGLITARSGWRCTAARVPRTITCSPGGPGRRRPSPTRASVISGGWRDRCG